MKRLARLKLYGRGLVPVATPALVARYNETLEALGLAPTELSGFHVDGMGWSPEIAEERGERYYLSHGMTQPLAVIVRPEQRNKPVHTPFASYDRRIMRAWFGCFRAEIADITRDAALCLDFDRQLSRFSSPLDLLLVRYVTVRTHAGPLSEAEREQRALVEEFENRELGWFDADLRRRIIESARACGDLRFRRLHIPDLRYDEVHTFYTGLFGGLFVLRNLKFREHILVLQDSDEFSRFEDRTKNMWLLSDPFLLKHLEAEDVVDLDMDWYQRHPEALCEKLEYLALDAICGADPEVDFGKLTPAQRKQRLAALGGAVPESYFELERLIAEIEAGSADASRLSAELRLLLLHPHERFEPGGIENDVIWQLLCRLSPLDVMRLYIADKESFFEAYRSWPESKKRWAAKRIAGRYRPKMNL